jgi:low affinity Fe/Cu permease
VSYPGFAHGWFGYPELVYEEDGLFETATAVVLFVCIVLLVGAVRRDAWRADRRLAAAMLAIAFAFLLLMLEELSWGQRIVGWETPEDIGELNAQDETNLQNMFVGYNQLIRLAIALVRTHGARAAGAAGGGRLFRSVRHLCPRLWRTLRRGHDVVPVRLGVRPQPSVAPGRVSS